MVSLIKSMIVVAFSNNSLSELHIKYFSRTSLRLQHSSRICLTVREHLHSSQSGWLSPESRYCDIISSFRTCMNLLDCIIMEYWCHDDYYWYVVSDIYSLHLFVLFTLYFSFFNYYVVAITSWWIKDYHYQIFMSRVTRVSPMRSLLRIAASRRERWVTRQ